MSEWLSNYDLVSSLSGYDDVELVRAVDGCRKTSSRAVVRAANIGHDAVKNDRCVMSVSKTTGKRWPIRRDRAVISRQRPVKNDRRLRLVLDRSHVIRQPDEERHTSISLSWNSYRRQPVLKRSMIIRPAKLYGSYVGTKLYEEVTY